MTDPAQRAESVKINCIIGSKVTETLLEGWILPVGGVASGRVCACSLCSRLVLIHINRNKRAKLGLQGVEAAELAAAAKNFDLGQ